MAQFFKAQPNKSKQLSSKVNLSVTQLDHLGAGIAQHQGKVVFIAGALPGETVLAQLVEQKKTYAKAKLIKIETASELRQQPDCPHYQQCGGCDLQHLQLDAQREYKQQTLTQLMTKFSGCELETMQTSIAEQAWQYRRRARLAIWFDKQSRQLTVGFRGKNSTKVISIRQCPVLPDSLSKLIAPFGQVLGQLSDKSLLGHLELFEVESGKVAVLRITKALKNKDKQLLIDFAKLQQVELLLQDNEGQCSAIEGEFSLPYYQLEKQLKLQFKPGNFIQVNGSVNQQMVTQALTWLDVQPQDTVLDLFCGVGNFSLPLAQHVKQVIGVEGVVEMVVQATANAKANNITNAAFYHADLSADLSGETWLHKVDKLLLDPARAGAYESLAWLKKMQPQKVLYVSCNPASLARDSAELFAQGYQLKRLGLVDMFPQTHHIEAMALFELK